ncbi:MAG: c-type cytochrome [Betaproteobacteria bacterium]
MAALAAFAAGCGEVPAGWDDVRADPANAPVVAQGAKVYAEHCAACHGANLEGQPRWRERLPNGRLPAPPHDETGHTWHHPDRVLFAITQEGLAPPYAPKGYESDMPAFRSRLSDGEAWAVLAYIKSRWRTEVWTARAEMASNASRR